MNNFKTLNRLFLAMLLVLTTYYSGRMCHATPMLNIYDPAIVHTLYGADKFYVKHERTNLTWHISPFFQHSATATRPEELNVGLDGGISQTGKKKVPIGNVNGRWNMFAIFHDDARPSGQSYPKFDAAKASIASLAGQRVAPDVVTNLSTIKDFTMEMNFNGDQLEDNAQCDYERLGSYSKVYVEYEKLGVRSQISIDFPFGLGFAVKSGVVNYRQTPKFVEDELLIAIVKRAVDATLPEDPTLPFDQQVLDFNQTAAKTILNDLMVASVRNNIARELGLNLCAQTRTTFEDTHANLYWHMSFDFERDGKCQFCFIPYLAVGVWLPTGDEADPSKPFSLATGNDGFTAVTAEANITIDFPETIQIGFGGGAAFFNTRTLTCQRVPTSTHQVGIIPWTTTISRCPGAVWYGNISMKAENFLDNFSFYIDYVYTEHSKDSIEVKETKASRCLKFEPEVLEKRSAWKAQHYNANVTYSYTPSCSLGFGIQGYINGTRTVRATTVMGSLIVEF